MKFKFHPFAYIRCAGRDDVMMYIYFKYIFWAGREPVSSRARHMCQRFFFNAARVAEIMHDAHSSD